jgi:hypothetical protein
MCKPDTSTQPDRSACKAQEDQCDHATVSFSNGWTGLACHALCRTGDMHASLTGSLAPAPCMHGKQATVAELKQKICDELGLPETQCEQYELVDYFQMSLGDVLSDPEKRVQEVKLMNNQDVLVRDKTALPVGARTHGHVGEDWDTRARRGTLGHIHMVTWVCWGRLGHITYGCVKRMHVMQGGHASCAGQHGQGQHSLPGGNGRAWERVGHSSGAWMLHGPARKDVMRYLGLAL